MTNGISPVNFGAKQQSIVNQKKSNTAKTILTVGLGATIGHAALKHTQLIYPKAHKFLKYGIPAAGIGLIGYGIYNLITKKGNSTTAQRDNNYGKSMLAGAAVAATALPLGQAVSGALIGSKFGKGLKGFFDSFKLLMPQMKHYTQAQYGNLLRKFGIKNLSANKTIALGTLAIAGLGALAGGAIHFLSNLSKTKNS